MLNECVKCERESCSCESWDARLDAIVASDRITLWKRESSTRASERCPPSVVFALVHPARPFKDVIELEGGMLPREGRKSWYGILIVPRRRCNGHYVLVD